MASGEGSRYWQGVIIDQDPPTYHPDKTSKFRFLGIGRGSPSGPTPDYFVFQVQDSPGEHRTPSGPLNVLPHRLILSEPALDMNPRVTLAGWLVLRGSAVGSRRRDSSRELLLSVRSPAERSASGVPR